MDKYTMVVVIVALVVIASAFKNWVAAQSRQADEDAKEASEASEATEARLQDLEERVQVLERIVTDQSERLKQEIDAL